MTRLIIDGLSWKRCVSHIDKFIHFRSKCFDAQMKVLAGGVQLPLVTSAFEALARGITAVAIISHIDTRAHVSLDTEASCWQDGMLNKYYALKSLLTAPTTPFTIRLVKTGKNGRFQFRHSPPHSFQDEICQHYFAMPFRLCDIYI